MARLLADDAFPQPVIIELRRLGHDIVGLDETGTLDHERIDEDVLDAAVATDRTLLTLDRRSMAHFLPARARRPGVIVCAFDRDFIGLANRIDAALPAHGSLDGQIIRIGRRRTVSA